MFVEKAKEIHKGKYDYSKVEYINNKTPVTIVCPVHGDFVQIPQGHLNCEIACPKCRIDDVYDRMIQQARAIHGDKYSYVRESFISVVKKMSIVCPVHGVYHMTLNNHVHGGAECKPCALAKRGESHRKTLDSFVEDAKKVHGNRYDYSKVVYEGNKKKITITCAKHGDFKQEPSSHLSGRGCPKCGLESRASKSMSTLERFIHKSRVIHGDKYDYSKAVYKGGDQKLTIICPLHGEFSQYANNHSSLGHQCPTCSKAGVSRGEFEVFNFVRSICPDAVQSDRTIIGPLELDVVVPSHSLAIEFNGLYWHDERTKDKKYHITKRHRVEAAGYRLISIREDIWNERREQVENIIRNALRATSDKVFARKCNIVEVSTSEAKTFMEKHHVQGFRGATVHYGLQHDDTLVAVISLTNWQKKNEWELVRYATACNVPGGLSRLWKHATTVNNIVRAYSYVDRDLFSGSSYINAGFTLSATTVGFRIVNGCTTESREKWNRAPDGMTQTQWYESEGVSRIYDSGQDKLLWVK